MNKKFSAASGPAGFGTSAFGQNQQQASTGFGAPSTGGMGAFGATATSTNLFGGGSTTSGFGMGGANVNQSEYFVISLFSFSYIFPF